MTFPSDDEWAEMDRRARNAYRLYVQARRLAVFLAGLFILFSLTWLVAQYAQPRRYDAWAETCSSHLRKNTYGE